jgi:hypothetical protein
MVTLSLVSLLFLAQWKATVPSQDMRLVYRDPELDQSRPRVPSPKRAVRRHTPDKLLSDAEQATVERQILPIDRQRWGEQAANCDRDFVVLGVAESSYTRPEARQKAILYRFCNTGHNFALNGIAVLENGDVAAHVVYAGGWDGGILALPSFDGTGRSGIQIFSGGMNQGVVWGVFSLIELSENGVRKFGHAATGEDDCAASPYAKPQDTSYTWFVKPGPAPIFTVRLSQEAAPRHAARPCRKERDNG